MYNGLFRLLIKKYGAAAITWKYIKIIYPRTTVTICYPPIKPLILGCSERSLVIIRASLLVLYRSH